MEASYETEPSQDRARNVSRHLSHFGSGEKGMSRTELLATDQKGQHSTSLDLWLANKSRRNHGHLLQRASSLAWSSKSKKGGGVRPLTSSVPNAGETRIGLAPGSYDKNHWLA